MKKSNLHSVDVVNDYVLEHSLRDTELLKRLREETAKDPASIMQIPPEQGQFMALLVKLMSAKKALEIGVFTGYSSLCVAQALPDDGQLIACDVSEKWTSIAKRYWEEAGVADKIDLRIAPASETLESLLDIGEAGSFDFVFIDADKAAYDSYYEYALKLLRPGGLIALDNMLFYGTVVDDSFYTDELKAHLKYEDIVALRAMNQKIKTDERVDLSMLPVADGITLARKR